MEYLPPDELVDDALGFINDVQAGRRGRYITPQQRSALGELAASLQTNAEFIRTSVSNAELVNSPEWLTVRKSAQRVLATFELG